jgi:hypothetical protein
MSCDKCGLSPPYENAFDITPSDVADLVRPTTGLTVTVGGTVRVLMGGGQTVTIQMDAAIIYPLRVTRVFSTGTSATGIVGFF